MPKRSKTESGTTPDAVLQKSIPVKDEIANHLRQGIEADLFTAEQTYALLKQIGQNANAINQANFGEFFGPLQSVLSNAVFLSVAKLFEEPSKKYPTRSISSVLKLLESSSHELLIEQRIALIKWLHEATSTS